MVDGSLVISSDVEELEVELFVVGSKLSMPIDVDVIDVIDVIDVSVDDPNDDDGPLPVSGGPPLVPADSPPSSLA